MPTNIRFIKYGGKNYTFGEFGALIGYSESSIWRHYLDGLDAEQMIAKKNRSRAKEDAWMEDRNLYEGCTEDQIYKLKNGIQL